MKSIKGTIANTEYTLNFDDLEYIKDECWTALDNAIDKSIQKCLHINAHIPTVFSMKITSAIIESLYKEDHAND